MNENELQKLTVLVVEDELPIRNLMVSTLKKDGFHVIEAADPIHATTMLGSKLIHIDLLVVDIIMPNMSGDEFANEMWTTHRHLKILFVSGLDHMKLEQLTRDKQRCSFLEKPFTIEAFRDAVWNLLTPAQ